MMYWTTFLYYGAHEGYPGHHTAFVVSEKNLFRELDQFEHAILMYNTPVMVIAEGIADVAINVLFSIPEHVKITLEEFCPDPKNAQPLEILVNQERVRHKGNMFLANGIYHKIVDNWSDEKTERYLASFDVNDAEYIKERIEFANDRTFTKSIFAHNLGAQLITKKFGENPSKKDFLYLLENPILPSDLT